MRKLAMLLLLLFSLPAALRADTLQFTLIAPVQSGMAGQTLGFYATLLAPADNMDSVYLDALTVNAPDELSVDTDDFYNLPLFLALGDSVTGRLFRLSIASDVPAVFSLAGLVTVQGRFGETSNTVDLVTAPFTVSTSVAVTPEPSSAVLLASGSLCCAAVVIFKKRRTLQCAWLESVRGVPPS